METTEVPLRVRRPVLRRPEREQPVPQTAADETGEREFARGDYTTAAQRATSRELRGCALIMLGAGIAGYRAASSGNSWSNQVNGPWKWLSTSITTIGRSPAPARIGADAS